MLELVTKLIQDEEGQGLAEYGLILALIAVVVIAALWGLGDKIREIFTGVTENFDYDGS